MEMKKRLVKVLDNQQGQSVVEYLVICGILIMAIVSMPSVYSTMSHTMKNKYRSYCFAVSISDPPRKEFDDSINQNADKIHEVLQAFKQLADLVKNVIMPDLFHGHLPDRETLQKLIDIIKSLF